MMMLVKSIKVFESNHNSDIKAVKTDDAPIVEALWNNALLEYFPSMSPKSTHVLKALDMICEFSLRNWRRNVTKDFLR